MNDINHIATAMTTTGSWNNTTLSVFFILIILTIMYFLFRELIKLLRENLDKNTEAIEKLVDKLNTVIFKSKIER